MAEKPNKPRPFVGVSCLSWPAFTDLPDSAKVLFFHLCHLRFKFVGIFWHTDEQLCSELKWCKTKLRDARRELRDAGLIQYGKERKKRNYYILDGIKCGNNGSSPCVETNTLDFPF